MTEHFDSHDSAEELQGKKVKTTREFSGIEEGTVGEIVEVYEYNDNKYGIGVEWETENGNEIIDGFSKDEYDKYLEEV